MRIKWPIRFRVEQSERDELFIENVKLAILRFNSKISYVEMDRRGTANGLKIHFVTRLTEWEREKLADYLRYAMRHETGSVWRVEVAEHWTQL